MKKYVKGIVILPNIGKQYVTTKIQTMKGSKRHQGKKSLLYILIFMDFYYCAIWLVPTNVNVRSRSFQFWAPSSRKMKSYWRESSRGLQG